MILIIDNFDSFTYNLYQIVSQATSEVLVLRNDEVSIDKVQQLSPDGIIISPGPGRPEDAGSCIEIIKYFSGIIPILGVCLGHQAIAVAFGGKVVKSDTIVHGKSSNVFHNRKGLYQNIPLPFQAGRYHSLVIERRSIPEELIIEAETAHEIIMGVKHLSHKTYGVQFHPESMLSEFGEEIIKNFIKSSSEIGDTL
ncbi:MAG: aminodeoxychorismate/anthranilate synthase component II [Legionellales bacterium RIFCSPHIGHO2_12_FULL_35_11]|nr:MAG: aminodeoxychorismate/anthranilate synthase component II [Legionellales bacterium RIFCSPHIGHO2_12_FULL_35_11]